MSRKIVGKYVRTTITVTLGLYKTMCELDTSLRISGQNQINWSAVANEAFRRRVNGDVSIELSGELIDLRHKLEELELRCGLSKENK